MTKVDARLNRGELQALLAAIDCFIEYRDNPTSTVWWKYDTLWWKREPHQRATVNRLRLRFAEED